MDWATASTIMVGMVCGTFLAIYFLGGKDEIVKEHLEEKLEEVKEQLDLYREKYETILEKRGA